MSPASKTTYTATVSYSRQSLKILLSLTLFLLPVFFLVFLIYTQSANLHWLIAEISAESSNNMLLLLTIFSVSFLFVMGCCLCTSIRHLSVRILITEDYVWGTDSLGKSFLLPSDQISNISALSGNLSFDTLGQHYSFYQLSRDDVTEAANALKAVKTRAKNRISSNASENKASSVSASSGQSYQARSTQTSTAVNSSSNSGSLSNDCNRAYGSSWNTSTAQMETSVISSNAGASFSSGSSSSSAPGGYASSYSSASSAYGSDSETSIISSNFSSEHNRTAYQTSTSIHSSDMQDMETSLDDGGTNILSANAGYGSQNRDENSYTTLSSTYVGAQSETYSDDTVLGTSDYSGAYGSSAYSGSWRAASSYSKGGRVPISDSGAESDDDFFTNIR